MIQPVMMRTRGLYGPFFQRYKSGWVHSVGNKFSASLLQQILAIPGIAGYWSPQPGYVFEDAAATVPATLNGVVGCCNSLSTPAIQATTAVKPYWRETSTSNIYWIESNAATSALTATLGNLGSACTIARADAEGVTFTENVTISSTYNIAPSYVFNSEIAIFNRALTDTEKDLITRYMQRFVPVLGTERLTNGTFDTDLTGWVVANVDATHTMIWEAGAMRAQLSSSSPVTTITQAGSITSGKPYVIKLTIKAAPSGSISVTGFGSTVMTHTTATAGITTQSRYANGANVAMYRGVTPTDVSVDSLSVKEIL